MTDASETFNVRTHRKRREDFSPAALVRRGQDLLEVLQKTMAFSDIQHALWLIDNGAAVTLRDENGHNALCLALAAKGDADSRIARAIIAGGVPELPPHHAPYLKQAAKNGRIQAVEALLAAGADINALDVEEQTALNAAVFNDDTAMIQYLADRGAMIEFTDRWDTTPLMWAAHGGHEKSVDLLLSLGANPGFKDKEHLSIPDITRGSRKPGCDALAAKISAAIPVYIERKRQEAILDAANTQLRTEITLPPRVTFKAQRQAGMKVTR